MPNGARGRDGARPSNPCHAGEGQAPPCPRTSFRGIPHTMDDPDSKPVRKYPARQPWKRHHNRSIIAFVTVCSKDRQPILAERKVVDLIVDQWKLATAWHVGRYVIMPDHIHLFASPNGIDALPLENWIQFWKSRVSRNWPGEKPKSIWQRSMWDRQLRSGDSYAQKWEYVRNNPVRHGLVEQSEDWPYQGELNMLPWHD